MLHAFLNSNLHINELNKLNNKKLETDDEIKQEEEEEEEEEEECTHTKKKIVAGQETCIDCGMTFQTLSKEHEWRYYGNEDNHHKDNPSRCHINKQEKDDKSILGDIAPYDFPEIIKAKANEIYQHHLSCSKKQIYRNDSRRGIIFECLFLSFLWNGQPKNPDLLYKLLNIKKKVASCGIKEIHLTCFVKYIYPIMNNRNITVFTLLPEFLKLV